MTKFTEKSLHSYPMAFYYAAMKAMDDRTAAVETALERFLTMETEFHRLFTAFDVAYKNHVYQCRAGDSARGADFTSRAVLQSGHQEN